MSRLQQPSRLGVVVRLAVWVGGVGGGGGGVRSSAQVEEVWILLLEEVGVVAVGGRVSGVDLERPLVACQRLHRRAALAQRRPQVCAYMLVVGAQAERAAV